MARDGARGAPSTSNGAAAWAARKNGLSAGVQERGGFVIIRHIRGGVRRAAIRIVPTPVVEDHRTGSHARHRAQPGRNGSATIRALRFFGEHKAGA